MSCKNRFIKRTRELLSIISIISARHSEQVNDDDDDEDASPAGTARDLLSIISIISARHSEQVNDDEDDDDDASPAGTARELLSMHINNQRETQWTGEWWWRCITCRNSSNRSSSVTQLWMFLTRIVLSWSLSLSHILWGEVKAVESKNWDALPVAGLSLSLL